MGSQRSLWNAPHARRDTQGERDQDARRTLPQTAPWPVRVQSSQALGGGFAQQTILPLAGEKVSVIVKHRIISIALSSTQGSV